VPAIDRPYERLVTIVAILRTGRLALMVEDYRSQTGGLPPDPTTLDPAALESVGPDPFSGEPLGYRKLGKGYMVYSVGPDGQDNNGHDDPERPWAGEAGTDIVFRVLR